MRKKLMFGLGISLGIIAIAATGVIAYVSVANKSSEEKAAAALTDYFAKVGAGRYEELFSQINLHSQALISEEDYVSRNKNIYEGIEAKNITVAVKKVYDLNKKSDYMTIPAGVDEGGKAVEYSLRMDTAAGMITYDAYALLTLNLEGEYRIVWEPRLIFPGLSWEDKVRVNTFPAERGAIYDRDGRMMAGKGVASSVGLVPGKMNQDSGADIRKIAGLLELPEEDIQAKLSASYVKEDTFVPLKTVAKDLQVLKDDLLKIPGIMIDDQAVRFYPMGSKASHLIGYVQSITAEELEELQGQGYHMNSELGKAGAEKLYEERLRPQDGCEIVILDKEGNIKETVAKREKADGENIQLTIDAWIQEKLYDQFAQDKSCAVAVNAKTGEVLALVSTPTYNANDFVLGMSTAQWTALNEDKTNPLFNRFKAAYCPGSTFKAITAAIAVDTGTVVPDEDFGPSGLTWKKDDSWGGYTVVTTKEYSGPANIENALKHSDNIYFAKAALRIGAGAMAQRLCDVGFEEELPFDFGLTKSTFSSTKTFATEIQLADSGYGQGEILINPLHLAGVYSAFVNQGCMINPSLLKSDNAPSGFWKQYVFKPDTAQTIRAALIQVVESGTGTDAQIPGRTLAGKTGTAEIKASVDDQSGTELGWFVLMDADEQAANPLLVVAMVEDVKGRGGSHYVVPKLRSVFE
ncbi:MAG: penicillin-binding transpeptidase domain-containing protein [Gracilibacteraceae bacterium]|jgi:penicillin-binding protein|nr:penicillin-binding transpeptidase domain-containing protein [Gracilibacteraceae bacterium]